MASCYHLRHVLYQEIQKATEYSSRFGVTIYMEVDENVPEALLKPDLYTPLNCSSVLNWIIRALLVPEKRNGDQILVSCRLTSLRTTGEDSVELELSVSGGAVVFTPEDLERVAKASADSTWLASAISQSCLSIWGLEGNHPGHAECLANSTFAHAVRKLIDEGGRLWIENDRASETRAIITLPSIEAVSSSDMEDDWPLPSFSGGDILFAARSPSLDESGTLSNILTDLGFRLSHSWYEYELERIRGAELFQAVMTSSPNLVDQKAVTRINVRWCMDRHVCAILSSPLTHKSTYEALQKAQSWHPTLFSFSGPSPPSDILVAEDNIVNQKVITKLLEKLYHKVEVVENGLLAVDAVANRWHGQRPYDLILIDTYMPVMNGFDAMHEIHRFEDDNGFPPTPTVMLCVGRGIDLSRSEWARALDEGLHDIERRAGRTAQRSVPKKIETLCVEVDKEGVKGTKADYNKINGLRAENAKWQ
ncbi:hypothetical protein M407DRAFT_10848 [Tulasnella calospora MUT 4182]|uniref:Response regulatory domain-containing protein n=1 Tax=Tulasnella calospora MUT 4182 TaxID=1051891 RepID=A0A0C3Q9B4_9AGAM|nr:hypothetical protein M407DRAFT_10848 [Tulasnella calospora MUT 4182]